MVHDYIQWLFPLPEASRFNPEAPLLSAADKAAFRTDPDLQLRALKALDLLLGFWGFARNEKAIVRAPDFAARSANWLEPTNHNHLRLTRVLLFLGHAGLTAHQAALLACLEDITIHEGLDAVTPRTLSFWRDAVRAPR
jgi:hypothetical protein